MWYNEHNSVIVLPTEVDVAEKVAEMERRVWDREAIREGALQLRARFWHTLIEELQRIFCQHQVKVDAAEYASRHFVHKMGL